MPKRRKERQSFKKETRMLPPRSGQSKRKKKRGSKRRPRTRQKTENPKALKKEKTKLHRRAQAQRAQSAGRDKPRINLDLGRNGRSHGKRRRNVLRPQRDSQQLSQIRNKFL